jgi:hypothetical protein
LLGSPNRRQSLRESIGDRVIGAFRDQDLGRIAHVTMLVGGRSVGLTVALHGAQQTFDSRSLSIQ